MKRLYVVCPCCGRSEQVERMMGRDLKAPGSFWSLAVTGSRGRPTREESAAARAAGLDHAPNRGFVNKVQHDVAPDAAVMKELVKRAQAFLKAMGED